MDEKDKYAVIMAGGVGSRFWPVSRTAYPKQFQDMLGTGKSLLQQTFLRLNKIVPQDHIFILTNTDYVGLVTEQLPEVSGQQIIAEPAMRNTAPCILLSALKINKENPKASMIVAPSDHWIEDEEAFAKDVNKAFEACFHKDLLVTLGITPTFPNTGYGYIKYDKHNKDTIKSVEKFTEKPDYASAQSFLKEGNYLWNAGIFIWKTSFIIDQFQNHLPDMFDLFKQGWGKLNTTDEEAFLKDNYPNSESISIDYGILEKAKQVGVIEATFDWSDLGTWGSLHDQLDKDENDNVSINARSEFIESSNNILRTTKGKIAIIKGLNDYIVLENEDLLVILPKKDEQDIKTIRNLVMGKFGENLG
ncbi:mannose-1-phosphate guanylyltransferase [Psychroflexus torquis ATCC 700755]|uniref:mannose-1-phosphate guanylyltransferase n=1 Tax=Psychroflexus torquis (strain ATCC 700755 / CIP 106069 / ACAM 623) TaxID=313595 RepID=K4IFF7_PSYTT|nr:mannose-1-phosphate guanylyltransferase [Psychroflexus torquis]AFU69277.1 mannose-1-phosphate guanylyltransferase [Psychroflexus torquis ATCC 700755]